jgi:hypothetical protein
MPEGALHQRMPGPGPNLVGNSRGDGAIDPQGQQGGTEGGQPGTPLADTDDSPSRRFDEKGARPV